MANERIEIDVDVEVTFTSPELLAAIREPRWVVVPGHPMLDANGNPCEDHEIFGDGGPSLQQCNLCGVPVYLSSAISASM